MTSLVATLACGGDALAPIGAVRLALGLGDGATADTLLVGDSVQLSKVRHATWTSSDTTIARVSSTGLVTGTGPGTATVTATFNRLRDSAQIVVLPAAAPADSSGAPADSSAAPRDSSAAPSDSSAAPTDSSAAPADSSAEPAPPPAPAPELTGTPVYPGESIQAKVNAAPAGTRFVIKAGVFARQTVTPKDGNAFVGEPGAVLDGQGVTAHAFVGSARNVVVQGLIIENYVPGSQRAALQGDNTVGWLVERNEFRYNNAIGLHTGTKMRVVGNHFHHNAQLGLGGRGDSVLVEGNEVAYNNYQKTYDYGWEAGCCKFVRTRWLVVRNNHVHDNWGPGIWLDIDNIHALVEKNRVENNASSGIFYEISYDGVIRDNVSTGNGFDESWLAGAGIMVNSSPNVQVYGNTVSGNRHGIMALEGPRGTGAYGPYVIRNLSVHHNRVTTLTGVSGFGTYDITSTAVYDPASNNRFADNAYWLGTNATPFAWRGDSKLTDSQWRGIGMDVTGTFTR